MNKYKVVGVDNFGVSYSFIIFAVNAVDAKNVCLQTYEPIVEIKEVSIL